MVSNLLSSFGQYCYSYFAISAAAHKQAQLLALVDHIANNDAEALEAAIKPLSLDVFTTRTPDTAQTLLMLGALSNNDNIHFALFLALDAKLAEEYPSYQPDADFEFQRHLNSTNYRAIIDAQDQNGNTALMLAAQADNEQGFIFAETLGPDFFVENTNGQTVMSLIDDLPMDSPVAHRLRMHLREISPQG